MKLDDGVIRIQLHLGDLAVDVQQATQARAKGKQEHQGNLPLNRHPRAACVSYKCRQRQHGACSKMNCTCVCHPAATGDDRAADE